MLVILNAINIDMTKNSIIKGETSLMNKLKCIKLYLTKFSERESESIKYAA